MIALPAPIRALNGPLTGVLTAMVHLAGGMSFPVTCWVRKGREMNPELSDRDAPPKVCKLAPGLPVPLAAAQSQKVGSVGSKKALSVGRFLRFGRDARSVGLNMAPVLGNRGYSACNSLWPVQGHVLAQAPLLLAFLSRVPPDP